MRFSFLLISMTLVASVLSVSCREKEKLVRSKLGEVSLGAEIVRLDVQMSKMMYCNVSEIVDSYKNFCRLFDEVEKTTSPVFDRIIREEKLPKELYVFSVFSSTSDRGLEEHTVGLFDSQASCDAIEQFAHGKSIPVRQCHKWEDIVSPVKESAG
jgi:hypothetical protein